MSQNGWKKWQKRSGGNRYSAYDNRMVVIVTDTKSPFVYLMPLVLQALKNARNVEVYTRGSNIALFPAEENSKGAYKITIGARGCTPYITLAALVKQWNISPGVYDAHVEDDHVVFDTQQKPSLL
jgi:hypothetical protein